MIAAIDIGTNSVRLLIRDLEGKTIERSMHITRLGQGVDRSLALHPDAMARTLAVLETYGQSCRDHGVSRLRMTATSAARDASNRDEFFGSVEKALGQPPELIAGREEAELSFLGATSGLPNELKPCVVVDIGGGSTEFSFGSEGPEASVSLNIGSVRISERFLNHDPPLAKACEQASAFVAAALEEARPVVGNGARTWLGLAGTVTTFAAIELGLERYDRDATHGALLSRAAVTRILAELSALDLQHRRERLLQPERADVIVGGGLILKAIFDVFDVATIRVSESDILDGLAASIA